jgi:tetratricopeptide (TPR) repeat protein
LALAGLYTVQQQPAQAMQIYQQALVHFPQSENVCAMAIEAAEQNKDLKQADAIAAAGFKRMPVALFAYYRGRLALAQEKLAVAKKFMRQALKLDPQYRPAALVLGLLAEQEGDFKTAKKVYQDFLQRNESDLVIIDRLLQIYFNEQDFSAALAYAERLANLDASDLNLKLKLGILYLNAHRLADARGIFQEILAAMPDADKAWYYLGATEILVPDQAAAFQAWEHISEDSSLFAQARLHQAQLLWATAKKDPSAENEQAFMAFLDRYQTSPKLEADLLLIRAAYLQEQGERAAAIALLRKLGQEKKLDSDGQYYFMAILQEDGQKSEAMQVAEQLIKDHPDHAHALNFLGYALLEDPTKLAQAKVYIDKAAQLAPDDYHIRDSVAWYYYQVGDYAQAAREIKTALKDAPEDPSLNQHAGLIALSLKRPQEACQYLQQAWKFAPEDLRSEIAGQAESCPNFDFSNAAAPENPVPEVENQTADVAPSPSLSSPLPSANAPEGKPEAVGHAALEEGPSPSAAAPHKSEEPKALTPLINPLGEGADDPILLDPQDN